MGLALFLLVSGALGLGALRFWRSDAGRTRRVLRRTSVSKIADLVDGKLACIVGTVEIDGEPLTAMVTRRPCVAYDTTVQFFKGNDFSVPSQVQVERRLVPFFVVDATGRVRIDAPEAALCNKPVARSERFEERIVENGAKVRLVGSVHVDPTTATSGERGFRDGALKATITGTTKWPLLIDVED